MYKYINKICNTSYTNDNEIKWIDISSFKYLSEPFMHKYKDYLDWSYLCCHQHMSESFIKRHINYIYDSAALIASKQKLSMNFMHKYRDLLPWNILVRYQKMSESFIDNHISYIKDLDEICTYKKLSDKFIDKYALQLNWRKLSRVQKLSKRIQCKYASSIWWDELYDNWVYKSETGKKRLLQNTKQYECYDDYFIAYKGIRSDGYPVFKYHDKYIPGKQYTSFCDCSNTVNSIGFIVCDKETAKLYCDEKLIKVKVKYKDIGRIFFDKQITNNKYCNVVRCSKIEVIY